MGRPSTVPRPMSLASLSSDACTTVLPTSSMYHSASHFFQSVTSEGAEELCHQDRHQAHDNPSQFLKSAAWTSVGDSTIGKLVAVCYTEVRLEPHLIRVWTSRRGSDIVNLIKIDCIASLLTIVTVPSGQNLYTIQKGRVTTSRTESN